MKPLYLIGNWKMAPQTLKEARRITASIKRRASQTKKVTVALCPPSLYLGDLAPGNRSKKLLFGAQDVFWESEGSFTGEESAEMLKEIGATHIIVGHSERRALGETNETVAKKVVAVLRAKLTPVLCIGESDRDTEGTYLEFLKKEIVESLASIDKTKLSKIIIAYEPVWAIGKSAEDAMDSRSLHETALYIKKVLAEHFKTKSALQTVILYGGSATPLNTRVLLETSEIDGLLVGRASRQPEQFNEMIKIDESL